MKTITPFILAGGGGTRLWPISRKAFPKPLTAPLGEKTLLQETALRVTGSGFKDIRVICHEDIRFLVAQQLQDVNIPSPKVLLETQSKNTAAAVAMAALMADHPDDLVLILPADHLISPLDLFLQTIQTASQEAENNKIALFGIVPNAPSTQYGYIKKEKDGGVSFIEKPDRDRAEILYQQKNVYWNSGIILAKSSVLVSELEKFAPDILEDVQEIVASRYEDLDFVRFSPDRAKEMRDIAFDYAVLEKTDAISLVGAQFRWSDIGDWNAIWEALKTNPTDNIGPKNQTLFLSSSGCLVHSDDAFVSLVGVNDHIVISQKDAVLVVHKSQTQKVKEIPLYLKSQKRSEGEYHELTYRPWGHYRTVSEGSDFRIRNVHIKPGFATATQIHALREEIWVVIKGIGRSEVDNLTEQVKVGDTVRVPKNTAHRLLNESNDDLNIIEIQFGDVLSDDDIIRLEPAVRL